MLKEQYLIRLLDSFHLLTSFPNSFFLFSLNQADDSFFYKNINKNYIINTYKKAIAPPFLIGSSSKTVFLIRSSAGGTTDLIY
jgi:hypothetical protein